MNPSPCSPGSTGTLPAVIPCGYDRPKRQRLRAGCPRSRARRTLGVRPPTAAHLLLLVVITLSGAGCFGRLPNDAATRDVVLAPSEVLDLPLDARRPHWLFRDLPRWCGATEARFGDDGDERVLTARAARFRDEVAAKRTLEKMTPEYLAMAFPKRIAEGPHPIDYRARLPGEEAKANEYTVRQPSGADPEQKRTGQYVAVRSGKAIVLTESTGLPSEELVPALEAMVRAAERAQEGC